MLTCKYSKYTIISLLCIITACAPKESEQNTNAPKEPNKELTLSDMRKLDTLHIEITEPTPGEWLYSNNEKGQSFKTYINSTPVCPNSNQNKIYLQLLGRFDKVDMYVLKRLTEYIEVFFGLEVIQIGPLSDNIIPIDSRRYHMGNEQLHTKYILHKILVNNYPSDAIVSMAITSKDLYPGESWNFVFGQASLKSRVGVSSVFRYKTEGMDTTNCQLYINRIMKTSTHEICHMFSIKHCIDFECLMNGSNSLYEADKKPLWLCPECLAKVIWCTKYDIFERYNNLIEFSQRNGNIESVQFYKQSNGILKKRLHPTKNPR